MENIITSHDKPNVLIYRDILLPHSETFIKSQCESYKDFQPFYVGHYKMNGLEIPQNRILTISNADYIGKAKWILYRQFGFDFGLVRRLKVLRPVLLHAHFGPDGVHALTLVKKLRIPFIVTFWGYDITAIYDFSKLSFSKLDLTRINLFLYYRTYFRNINSIQNYATLFIAVSDFIRQKMIDRGFPEEKILRHYAGVDVDIFNPDQSVERESMVLFVGRLVEKKGCDYLIKAMARVQQKRPDIELVIIGDGPQRSSLESLGKETLVRYRFLGFQTHDKVRLYMNKAKVVCVPSITASNGDSEGLPTTCCEAGAMGTPVVGFSSAGIPEAIVHGETGFLAQEKDWEALADYILLLFNDTNLWKRFSINGRKRICETFNLHKQTRILENIYADVTKESYIST